MVACKIYTGVFQKYNYLISEQEYISDPEIIRKIIDEENKSIEKQNKEYLSSIFISNCKIEPIIDYNELTKFEWSISLQQYHVTNLLIEQNYSVNQINHRGNTPIMHVFLYHGLRAYHLPYNKHEFDYRLVHHDERKEGYYIESEDAIQMDLKNKLSKLLLENAADITIRNKNNQTAKDLAILSKAPESAINTLNTAEVIWNIKQNHTLTASEESFKLSDKFDASLAENIEKLIDNSSINFAIEHGLIFRINELISENISNIDKNTVIKAAQNGHLNSIIYMLNKGFDINYADENKKTLLISAAEYNHLDIVLYLLNEKPLIDLADSANKTAIMFAAENENKDMLLALYNNKANILNHLGHSIFFAKSIKNYDDEFKIFILNNFLDVKNNKVTADSCFYRALDEQDISTIQALAKINFNFDSLSKPYYIPAYMIIGFEIRPRPNTIAYYQEIESISKAKNFAIKLLETGISPFKHFCYTKDGIGSYRTTLIAWHEYNNKTLSESDNSFKSRDYAYNEPLAQKINSLFMSGELNNTESKWTLFIDS